MSIIIENLSKTYDGNTVLESINMKVPKGSIYGVLGRNGAGKTTLLECMVGLREADQGLVYIQENQQKITFQEQKDRVGVQPQNYSLFERLTVKETFALFSSFYKKSISVDSLIEKLQLTELENKQIKKLSSGQKQRVVIGVALIGDPEILLLDEPSAGLDVQVRMVVWEIIKELREEGKTIILTTHYMEEAEELCDLISILHNKKIVISDNPKTIIEKHATINNQNLGNAFMELTGTNLRLGVD